MIIIEPRLKHCWLNNLGTRKDSPVATKMYIYHTE